MKDAKPSAASSVKAVAAELICSIAWYASPASIACLAICTAIGARAAILLANAWAVSITSAFGTSWLATPQARARSAISGSPVKINSLARPAPTKLAKPTGAAPSGQGANADLGQPERRIVGEDPQVAGQSQLEPAAVRVAGNGCDGRLSQAREPVEHPVPKAGPQRPHVQRLQRLEAFDVGAGAEGAIPDSGDEDDPDIPVGIEADQDLLELPQHFRRQRIVLGRPVEARSSRPPQSTSTADLADVRSWLEFAHVGPSLGSGGVRPRSTWCAPFSPIMVEVAMVLPLINFGMIDASITRRPSIPRTLSS